MRNVNEVSKLCGISKRTLHYYDSIGLLKPSNYKISGYRLYDEKNLEQLWQILFYKELGFSLQQIKSLLNASTEKRFETLKRHKELILNKLESLNNIIVSIDKILIGEFEENMLKNFDMKEIEDSKMKYGCEAKERWGDTDAYKESARRTSGYTKEDWSRIKTEQNTLYYDFIKAMDKGFDSMEAQEAVRHWHKNLNENFYECSKEMLAGLGSMYANDERFKKNIDKYKDGLADFMSRSIQYYSCK